MKQIFLVMLLLTFVACSKQDNSMKAEPKSSMEMMEEKTPDQTMHPEPAMENPTHDSGY